MEKQTKKRVPEFTSVRDERVKILANSCIRKIKRIRIRKSRKSFVARPREGWRNAVSKFRGAVSMKIGVEKR